jgi:hypothetical protein
VFRYNGRVNGRNFTELELKDQDGQFLAVAAEKVLGSSAVAATTASRLRSIGIDPQRINTLLPWASVAVHWGGYVFKKVEADQETPDNFGLFVRRKVADGMLPTQTPPSRR